ncbi:MAG: DinB family protein [Meiothermus ruber]|jgi:uncharacterized damage-inducible protein DinB|uniref:DinB family protein n=1 Tax=Meiothermus ruber TaxID=277 RepID=UPI00391C143A
MNNAELKRIIDAHDWLWEKWWPVLLALTPEQAHREVGGSFPSVLATTAHMVGAEMVWLERLQGNPTARFPDHPAEIRGLYEAWQQLTVRRKDWLYVADPNTQITYSFSAGTATNTVAEIVLHVASHAHFHRGQLAAQMRLLGLQPPSAHFIGFFRR